MLDLLSLVAACTIGAADAPLWQSLVLTESHARPFSLRRVDDGRSYAFPSAETASAAAVQLTGQGHRVRFGLAAIGGSVSLDAPPSPILFEPCANLLAASKRLEGLRLRCARDAAGSRDPIGCAVAAYHGSFEHRDDQAAAEIIATAAMGQLPNPAIDTGPCAATAAVPAQAAASPAPATVAGGPPAGAPALVAPAPLPGEPSPQERAWLAGGGGLFPAGGRLSGDGQGGTVLVRRPGGAR